MSSTKKIYIYIHTHTYKLISYCCVCLRHFHAKTRPIGMIWSIKTNKSATSDISNVKLTSEVTRDEATKSILKTGNKQNFWYIFNKGQILLIKFPIYIKTFFSVIKPPLTKHLHKIYFILYARIIAVYLQIGVQNHWTNSIPLKNLNLVFVMK